MENGLNRIKYFNWL